MTFPLSADCHVHIFRRSGHPYAPDATYIPQSSELGSAAALTAVLDAHGLTHALIVNPEPYRIDNSAMLEAIASSHGRFRGIALVEPSITERDLDALVDGGVVGVRFNLSSFGSTQITHSDTPRLLAMLRDRGMVLQVHSTGDELAEALAPLRAGGVRLVIDHFARPHTGRGLSQPGFAALLELGRSSDAVVKLSGPFRSSVEGYPYRDVDPFVHAAVDAFSIERCVWGSDWPFVLHDSRIDYGPQLACLSRWFPDANVQRKILCENPSRIFGFGGRQARA
jgi:predicted TIM-barrel fold metal-dependent hydrolase